jgi:hypothetical protein
VKVNMSQKGLAFDPLCAGGDERQNQKNPGNFDHRLKTQLNSTSVYSNQPFTLPSLLPSRPLRSRQYGKESWSSTPILSPPCL